MTIKTLKNFASMDQSFKEWLTTCPREYIWQINEVTEDLEGNFTFRRINDSIHWSAHWARLYIQET